MAQSSPTSVDDATEFDWEDDCRSRSCVTFLEEKTHTDRGRVKGESHSTHTRNAVDAKKKHAHTLSSQSTTSTDFFILSSVEETQEIWESLDDFIFPKAPAVFYA